MSKGKTAAGIIFAVLLIGGVIVFRMMISSAPAEARNTAQKFLDALGAGDAATAKSLCTSEVDLAALDRLLVEMKMWGSIQSKTSMVSIPRGSGDGPKKIDFACDVEFATVKKTYSVTVVESNGGYKVSAYNF